MWLQNILNYSLFGIPLWVIGLCGFIGVLIDLDHLIAYYWLRGFDGRFLHTPLLITCSIILFGLGTYIAGLLIWMVLK